MYTLPNYIKCADYLGEYIEDLRYYGLDSLEHLNTCEASPEMVGKVCNHLEAHGTPPSHRGLPNKGYTVWAVDGKRVDIVSKHDFQFCFWRVDADELRAALALKYDKYDKYEPFYASLDSLMARFKD